MKQLSSLTDYELVGLYEKGNDSAFDELLNRYKDYTYSYILFLTKSEAEAEDILQEVFTRVIIAIRSHKYQTTGKFSSWLIRIAHNLFVDHKRNPETARISTRQEFPPSMLNSLNMSEASHEGRFIAEQESARLREMLDYLPEVQRDVVVLRFYEDLSFKEIAQRTGVSINTALGRMRYALINLRRLVGPKQMAMVG